MRRAWIALGALLHLGSCAAAGAEQTYRADVGAGALRLVTDTAGGAFGVLCAAGGCALVHYPARPGFANGDDVFVEAAVDGGSARALTGVAFEDRGGDRVRLGVAFRADEALAAALATGSSVRLGIVRGGRAGARAHFDLVGLTRVLARLAQPAPVRAAVRYD